MKEFKLYDYRSLELSINLAVKELNDKVNVSSKLAPYIDGRTVDSISRSAVLDALKVDSASHLPGFLDYLKAGVNLASTIPNCEVSDRTLSAIENFVAQHQNSQLRDGLRYVAYSKKEGKFVPTNESKAALDKLITRLTKADEKTYELTEALFAHLLTSYGTSSMRRLLKDSLITGVTNELNVETLVGQIKYMNSRQ